jgi:hypothetical protein
MTTPRYPPLGTRSGEILCHSSYYFLDETRLTIPLLIHADTKSLGTRGGEFFLRGTTRSCFVLNRKHPSSQRRDLLVIARRNHSVAPGVFCHCSTSLQDSPASRSRGSPPYSKSRVPVMSRGFVFECSSSNRTRDPMTGLRSRLDSLKEGRRCSSLHFFDARAELADLIKRRKIRLLAQLIITGGGNHITTISIGKS